MYRTFNNGIGMVICVSQDDVESALTLLEQYGETAYQIGHIASTEDTQPKVVIR